MTRLSDVNTTDIRGAIELGCLTMCSVSNADDNDIPFFGSSVLPEAGLGFSACHSEAHVPGRHLNALLNAEDAIGIKLDEECTEKHARAAFFSYGGPVALPLNRQEIGGPLVNFVPHNIREGFHALYALAGYRQSARALDLARRSIRAIVDLWTPGMGWDLDRIEGELGLSFHSSSFISGVARSIGPLVKLYRATGLSAALELAILLADKALGAFFTEEGRYDRDMFGTHTHSVTCVMSSLAQLADLTRDSHMMNRVIAFYNNGLNDMRDALGWVIESAGEDAEPDRGEVNNTGDIVETALILGRWGYTRYYEDAERILRGHLLPSQLRDISFIKDPPNPEGVDGKRDVASRHRGAFGFPAPYGHRPLGQHYVSFNMDIVGGAVGSLCEAYREVVRRDEAGIHVNLLFDHETEDVEVESPYTHECMRVRVKREAPLFVRVPSWATVEAIEVQGAAGRKRFTNGYLLVAEPPMGEWIGICFNLPEREITLAHRTRSIRVRLRGDAVVAMDNFGADLTFFEPFERG